MSASLERSYRWLLFAYPAAYRSERSDELLDTLMEAAPAGRRRPTMREATALLLGGLRVRAAQNRRLSAWVHWRLAVVLGISMWLASESANLMGAVILRRLWSQDISELSWHTVLGGGLTLTAAVVAWFARPSIVTAAALTAAAATVDPFHLAQTAPDAILLVMLAILGRGKERPPKQWLILLSAAALLFCVHYFPGLYVVGLWLPRLVGVGVLLWTAVDARPAIALTVWLVVDVATGQIATAAEGGMTSPWWAPYTPLLYAVILAAPAIWRMRRQALL